MWEIVLVLLAAQFLPTIIAVARGHQSSGAIFLLNLLLGWTGLGWIAALIWSCSAVYSPAMAFQQQGPIQQVIINQPGAREPDRGGPVMQAGNLRPIQYLHDGNRMRLIEPPRNTDDPIGRGLIALAIAVILVIGGVFAKSHQRELRQFADSLSSSSSSSDQTNAVTTPIPRPTVSISQQATYETPSRDISIPPQSTDPLADPQLRSVPWRHTTPAGTRWSLRTVDDTRMALFVDLDNSQTARIVVTPEFQNLSADAIAERVDWLKSSVKKDFSVLSSDYSFSRDGVIRRFP